MTNTRLDYILPFWWLCLLFACAHTDCLHRGHTVVLVPVTEVIPSCVISAIRSRFPKTATSMLDFWNQPAMDYGLHSVAVNYVRCSWHQEYLQVRQQVDQLSLNNNRLFSEPLTLLVNRTTNTCGHNSLFCRNDQLLCEIQDCSAVHESKFRQFNIRHTCFTQTNLN